MSASQHTSKSGPMGVKNLVGTRVGKLLVLHDTGKRNKGRAVWLCRCDCGNEIERSSDSLWRTWVCQSCGCHRVPDRPVVANPASIYTIVRKTEKRERGAVLYECRCQCGNIRFLSRKSLLKNKSCGCLDRWNNIFEIPLHPNSRIQIIREVGRSKSGKRMIECRCECGEILYCATAELPRRISCGCVAMPPLKTPEFKLTNLDLAWIAGFFDGEGTVTICRPGNRMRGGRKSYSMSASVVQANYEILAMLKESFGGYLFEVKGRYLWRWSVHSFYAVNFLKTVVPFLRLKKTQAELAILFQMDKRRMGRRKLPPERIAFEEDIRRQISGLNGNQLRRKAMALAGQD